MMIPNIAVAVVALLVLAGCVPVASGPPAPALEARTVRLTEADGGTAVELRVGDTLEVSLATNPSTGYSWQVAFPTLQPLEQVGKPEYRAEGNQPGSGGRALLRFRAVAPGTVRLMLAYRRPSSLVFPTPDSFEVGVTVR